MAISVINGLLLGGPLAGAEAHPSNSVFCREQASINWTFSGPGWTTAMQGAVRTGMAAWNGLRTEDNASVVTSTEVSGGIPVSLASGASTNCNSVTHTITSMTIVNSPGNLADMQNAAAHEVGHAFGLAHTGYHDNVDTNDNPLMSLIGHAPAPIPGQDDAAHVYHRMVSTPVYNANPGFENGLSYWNTFGSVTLVGAVPKSGVQYAQVNPNSSLISKTRYTRPSGPSGSIYYKTNSSNAVYKISYREIGYGNTAPPCDVPVVHCDSVWPAANLPGYLLDLMNPSFPSGTNWVTAGAVTLPASSNWVRTDAWLPGGINWSYLDGVEIQLTVNEPATATGVLFVDNVEIRD